MDKWDQEETLRLGLGLDDRFKHPQHFDARNIHDVQQGALRTGNVDIIQIHTHARIYAPQRIGLTHTTDVGGDGGARSACGVDGQIGDFGVQIADIFDALTSERPYKKPWSRDDAFAELSLLVAKGKLDNDCV